MPTRYMFYEGGRVPSFAVKQENKNYSYKLVTISKIHIFAKNTEV